MADAEVFDTLIVGAGAAGLVAAAELGKQPGTVCVLEARDRLGGRIHTRREPGVSLPVELGAEFIHGRSPATFSWLARSNTAVVDAGGERWVLRAGKPQPGDNLWAEMKSGLRSIPRPRKDLPFSEFLERVAARKLSPAALQLARRLVEGFDAADATRVSTLATLDEWNGSSAADAPTFRPLGGYAALIDGLVSGLDTDCVRIRLSTIVQSIEWQRGRVTIEAMRHGLPTTVQGRRAIITLPIGVLQASAADAVRFNPDPRKQKALDGLACGPVIKVVLHFREPFWEQIDGGRYRDAAFFNAPGSPFPTFWCALPLRGSLLNAWAGGPYATRLADKSEAQLAHAAIESLQSAFGRKVRVRRLLERAYLHDWQADPFARGAYSYVVAGGASARKALAAPVQDTLFFAGEAADTGGESGTVAGALQSGMRAARLVVRNSGAD
ncbi:MAG TPA: NAD(P)/FAD-dependent oxidoreductase [Steroidobacteraceae bacterium]|nr:NAD(P)/FAD-dependent oxidoreductase [Steroidobacteraceae bacterium]